MDSQKALEFHGTAGGYFVVFLVTLVGTYIPFFGWAFVLNFTSEWLADNALVNGRQVKYSAGYGESLKFVFINMLLLLITFGIYMFWFVPKAYRYFTDHVSYAGGGTPMQPMASAPVSPTMQPPTVTPTQPSPAVIGSAPNPAVISPQSPAIPSVPEAPAQIIQ